MKKEIVSGTGPAADTSVDATSPADIDIPLAPTKGNKILDPLGIREISGLPDGVVPVGITFPDATTCRLRVFNTGSAAVTITANSVTVKAYAKVL